MILLGISGKKRTGKNAIAKIIATLTTLKVKEYAFADELKTEVARFCGVSRAAIDNDKELYRPLLQAWGTYRRQTKGTDYWVTKVIKAIHADSIINNDFIAVITDVRYQNEYNFFGKMQFLVGESVT